MILKLWYITWEGRKRGGIKKKHQRKKTKELVTEKRTLGSGLSNFDRVTQAMPRTIFVFYILNTSSKPPMIVTFFFLNQTSSFSHTLQIYCLGLLGQNPILFRVQTKTGPYNCYIFYSYFFSSHIIFYKFLIILSHILSWKIGYSLSLDIYIYIYFNILSCNSTLYWWIIVIFKTLFWVHTFWCCIFSFLSQVVSVFLQ